MSTNVPTIRSGESITPRIEGWDTAFSMVGVRNMVRSMHEASKCRVWRKNTATESGKW